MATFHANFKENNSSFNAKFGTTTFVHTDNYEDLYNQPSIEDVVLVGNKTFEELGMSALSQTDVEKILYLG